MDIATERRQFTETHRETNEMGRLSFAYFSLAKHDCMDAGGRATQEQLPKEKVTRAAGKQSHTKIQTQLKKSIH